LASVVLPLPDAPTSAIFSPSRICKEMFSVQGAPLARRKTERCQIVARLEPGLLFCTSIDFALVSSKENTLSACSKTAPADIRSPLSNVKRGGQHQHRHDERNKSTYSDLIGVDCMVARYTTTANAIAATICTIGTFAAPAAAVSWHSGAPSWLAH